MVPCSTQNPHLFWHENLYKGMQAMFCIVQRIPLSFVPRLGTTLLSLVASDKVFPGAEPKCIVLYILALYLHIPSLGQETRLAHTLLHNLLTTITADHQLNWSLLCHSVKVVPTSILFFFQVHFPVEQFAKGSITKQYYHVLTLKGSFHIDVFCGAHVH